MFILLSERPEYEKKLVAVVQVAPIAYLDHMKKPSRTSSSIVNSMPSKLKNSLNRPYPTSYDGTQTRNPHLTTLCRPKILATTICRAMVNIIIGPDDSDNNLVSNGGVISTTLPRYLSTQN